MPHYLVIAMRRPGFDDAVVGPHLAWLDDLQARGLLALTGGFSDRSGGAYVLRGLGSLAQAQAQALVATDPLAVTASSDITVHEWNARDASAG